MAVTGAVMQCAIDTDRCPSSTSCGSNYFCSDLNLPLIGRESFEDRADLAGMNAPHAREAELVGRLLRCAAHRFDIVEFGDNAMRRHLAVRMGGGSDFELCAHHERMSELSRSPHAIGRNRTAMGGHEIHQTEAERLHAWMRGDLECMVNGKRRFDQHMQ